MMVEGLKLMVIGMTTVMIFLWLMILVIQLITRLTKEIAAREFEILQQAKQRRAQEVASPRDASPETVPIAVIAAAIARYEADKQRIASP